MSYCSIRNCKSKRVKGGSVRFFKFPRNESLAEKWLQHCKPRTKVRTARVCSIHFVPSDYYKPLQHILLNYSPVRFRPLKADAVPTQHIDDIDDAENPNAIPTQHIDDIDDTENPNGLPVLHINGKSNQNTPCSVTAVINENNNTSTARTGSSKPIPVLRIKDKQKYNMPFSYTINGKKVTRIITATIATPGSSKTVPVLLIDDKDKQSTPCTDTEIINGNGKRIKTDNIETADSSPNHDTEIINGNGKRIKTETIETADSSPNNVTEVIKGNKNKRIVTATIATDGFLKTVPVLLIDDKGKRSTTSSYAEIMNGNGKPIKTKTIETTGSSKTIPVPQKYDKYKHNQRYNYTEVSNANKEKRITTATIALGGSSKGIPLLLIDGKDKHTGVTNENNKEHTITPTIATKGFCKALPVINVKNIPNTPYTYTEVIYGSNDRHSIPPNTETIDFSKDVKNRSGQIVIPMFKYKQLQNTALKFNALKNKLSKIFTSGQLRCLLSSKKGHVKWSVEDISAAVTLKRISPTCYDYLKYTVGIPLPACSTLRQWAARVRARLQTKLEAEEE